MILASGFVEKFLELVLYTGIIHIALVYLLGLCLHRIAHRLILAHLGSTPAVDGQLVGQVVTRPGVNRLVDVEQLLLFPFHFANLQLNAILVDHAQDKGIVKLLQPHLLHIIHHTVASLGQRLHCT